MDALNQGADDYLVVSTFVAIQSFAGIDCPALSQKPFQSRELLARVNVHLQLGKMRMELEKRFVDFFFPRT